MADKTRNILIKICNIFLALLCAFSIGCYFLFPFWQFSVNYTVDAETLNQLVGEAADIDTSSIFEDEVTLQIGFQIETIDLVNSFRSEQGEKTFKEIVNRNVNNIVKNLTDTLYSISKKLSLTITNSIVGQQVFDAAKGILRQLNPDITDDEINSRLDAIGINEEYFNKELQSLIDEIYNGGMSTEQIGNKVVESVRKTYEKVQLSTDDNLKTMTFTDENEAEIREKVNNMFSILADENGIVNPNELLAGLLLQALGVANDKSNNDSSDNQDESKDDEPIKTSITLLSEETTDNGSAPSKSEQLNEEISNMILGYVPNGSVDIIMWILRILGVLFILSSLTWLYTFIKIIVKFIRPKKSPTVRLLLPILLGWLPYLLLVGIPSLALLLFKLPYTANLLANIIPAAIFEMVGNLSLSLASAGIYAAISAGICLIVSFFYIAARRKAKKSAKQQQG